MNGIQLRRVSVLGCLVLTVLVSGTKDLSAQVNTDSLDHYRHTYDPEHGYVPYGGYGGAVGGYGGYGGYGGAVTPAMGAGIGIGAAASGVGQMHESNAQAQEIHQQAVTEFLQNRGLAQQTVLQVSSNREKTQQQRNDAQLAQEKAQLSLYNKTLEEMSAAHRLTAEQFDFTRNVLHWPFVLRGPQYSDLRLKIDQLYDARTPDNSGTNSSGFDGIQQACKQMQDIVDGEVKTGMPVNDYVTAKHFISSIEYEARFKVKPTAK